MAGRETIPSTQAVRVLKAQGVEFEPYFYKYVDHGGTKESSRQLGIEEHRIVKTLVFEDSTSRPFIVLMNGDYEVSQKALARALGVKKVKLADPGKAEKYTGYRVGGTSPFGLRTEMRIFAQRDIFGFDKILINGGKRGFLVEIATEVLESLLKPRIIDVAIKKGKPA